jgi:hypothetical protein
VVIVTKTHFLMAGLALLLSACSVHSPAAQTATLAPVASVSLSEADARMIRAYYSEDSRKKGRKKQGLPPGIAKNLQRGKPLPPGIAKQYLPQDLLVQLPRAGNGLEYIIVGGKLLLVEIATQIVRQILLDAVFD